MARKRVAILGIRHEAMIASPFLTDESATSVARGEAILDLPFDVVAGVVDALKAAGNIDIIPLLFARTLPGGPFTRAFYEKLKAESLSLLGGHGPFDGVIVLNHGAAEVDGLDRHGDTDYVSAIRALLGTEVPIAIPFDMHGQVTPELLDALTVMSSLRTAPHRDGYQTSRRAADQLIAILKGAPPPQKAAVHIPIMAPGEKVMTDYSPARELFGMLPDYDRRPGVVEAHLFVGFGWNDRSWCGMKAVVLTETDERLAFDCALDIARKTWEARERFDLGMETAGVVEGLKRARDDGRKAIYLSDSGDNVTAGAGGDLTFVLQDAIDLGFSDTIVAGIFAPEIVEGARHAGVGAMFEIEIGRHISARPQPRKIVAFVAALGARVDTSAYKNLRGSEAGWARLKIGGVTAIFHAARVDYTGPGHFLAVGVNPSAHAVYVVKVGYPHPQQQDMFTRHICLISEGIADLDFTRLTYERIERPCYPMDAAMSWKPESGALPGDRRLIAGTAHSRR